MRPRLWVTVVLAVAVALSTAGASGGCNPGNAHAGATNTPPPSPTPAAAGVPIGATPPAIPADPALRNCVGPVEPGYDWATLEVGGNITSASVTVHVDASVPHEVRPYEPPGLADLPVAAPVVVPQDRPWCMSIHWPTVTGDPPTPTLIDISIRASDPRRSPDVIFCVIKDTLGREVYRDGATGDTRSVFCHYAVGLP